MVMFTNNTLCVNMNKVSATSLAVRRFKDGYDNDSLIYYTVVSEIRHAKTKHIKANSRQKLISPTL